MTAALAAARAAATMASGSSGLAAARLLSRAFLCESGRDSVLQASASSRPHLARRPGPGRGWALRGGISGEGPSLGPPGMEEALLDMWGGDLLGCWRVGK